jgi:hypothetical protein
MGVKDQLNCFWFVAVAAAAIGTGAAFRSAAGCFGAFLVLLACASMARLIR